MDPTMKKILHWTPRVLGIIFPLFISVFALDVFGHGYGFWRTALALLIHLVPSFALAGLLLVAWRWRRVRAAIYAGLGAANIITAWGRFDLAAHLLISGPLFLMAALLLLDWRYGG